MDRAPNRDNTPTRKLTIINLKNCPMPDFTSLDLFRDVMTQLDELNISLNQKSNPYGGSGDYTHIELRAFPSYLINHWLAPISSNVRALSIYSLEDNWGRFPAFFDSSTVSFPQLQSLALWYYALGHNGSFDWILSIKTLNKFVPHNAVIATWIGIEPGNNTEWDPPMPDWIPSTLGDSENDCLKWEYPGR
ncbi:uncharacterized protein ALTATR162_LOCUS9622 [Alternaria atra]|uniref:Uncharacterized protein n=1 Tax=Alternaria atra TaxID=119953 RepID=A0A8J2IKU5_9PLEO|nr:uncharacterized protein ALTATR162_LOCUS9622 [Alternaria atra]CAG5181158.1 unnamed protein product [Alternaria atra]